MTATMDDSRERALGKDLVLDELFDLTLYETLLPGSSGPTRQILEQLIPVERRHYNFWKDFFKITDTTLDPPRRVKLRVLAGVCRLFGPAAVRLVLEAIEVYGIGKYLRVWERYKDGPLGRAVEDVLRDEFEHEDQIVTGPGAPTIRPDDVRSIFLGLNDGLVEMLGAASGFFAAFHQARLVLMAGSSVAVAGALSMAAGAFAASSSEHEVRLIERGKAEFLSGKSSPKEEPPRPFRSAALVGCSYFAGALVPLLPIILGARSLAFPLAAACAAVLLVSAVLAFLSGMDLRKRAATNLALAASAVAVTYAIGLLVRSVWGIEL